MIMAILIQCNSSLLVNKAKIIPVRIAKINPPIDPSQVLLGDILIASFVLPNNEPKTYAPVSLAHCITKKPKSNQY